MKLYSVRHVPEHIGMAFQPQYWLVIRPDETSLPASFRSEAEAISVMVELNSLLENAK